MTKKQKVVFAVVAVVIVLGMIMSYAFLMKNQHIDSTPEEKKMPAMSDTEDYEYVKVMKAFKAAKQKKIII